MAYFIRRILFIHSPFAGILSPRLISLTPYRMSMINHHGYANGNGVRAYCAGILR